MAVKAVIEVVNMAPIPAKDGMLEAVINFCEMQVPDEHSRHLTTNGELRDTLAVELARELFRHVAILRPSKDDLSDVYQMVDAVLSGRDMSKSVTMPSIAAGINLDIPMPKGTKLPLHSKTAGYYQHKGVVK